MRRRSNQIIIRLNDEELAHLNKQVQLSGLNYSTIIRKRIKELDVRPRPIEEQIKLLHEVSAIGNNINQIARAANIAGEATSEQVRMARELVEKVWQLMKERI